MKINSWNRWRGIYKNGLLTICHFEILSITLLQIYFMYGSAGGTLVINIFNFEIQFEHFWKD